MFSRRECHYDESIIMRDIESHRIDIRSRLRDPGQFLFTVGRVRLAMNGFPSFVEANFIAWLGIPSCFNNIRGRRRLIKVPERTGGLRPSLNETMTTYDRHPHVYEISGCEPWIPDQLEGFRVDTASLAMNHQFWIKQLTHMLVKGSWTVNYSPHLHVWKQGHDASSHVPRRCVFGIFLSHVCLAAFCYTWNVRRG
jgi:hypothetical protein